MRWRNWYLGPIFAIFLFLFYLLFLNHVHLNEIGVGYDGWDGSLIVQNKPGWYITSPLVVITYISTIPHMIELPSSARVINAKLVRFKPEGLSQFIALQGWQYNFSGSQDNIMMGYAFSGKEYPFLEIVQQSGPEENVPVRNEAHGH